jgi:hypothetical protein
MNAHVNEVLEVLNRAVKADHVAVEILIEKRVVCNKALADDPTIQVVSKDGRTKVGLLGLINGIVGIRDNGWGYIAACYEVRCPKCAALKKGNEGDDCPTCGTELELGKLLRFERTDSPNIKLGG